jgi:hypothetical protein
MTSRSSGLIWMEIFIVPSPFPGWRGRCGFGSRRLPYARLKQTIKVSVRGQRQHRRYSRGDGELIFAVCHVSEMLDALKVKYYVAYNGEDAIEP